MGSYVVLCAVGADPSVGSRAYVGRHRTAPAVLAEFRAATHRGGLLIIPVTVQGRRLIAAVDTGCAYTGVDSRLRSLLGDKRRQVTMRSPGGLVDVDVVDAPELSVEGLPAIRLPEGIAVLDLGWTSSLTKQQVELVLGIDAIKNHVLRFDGPSGVVSFLKHSTSPVAEAVPIRYVGGIPWVLGMMGQRTGAWFSLDTGGLSSTTPGMAGTLSRAACDALNANNLLLRDGREALLTQAGLTASTRYRLLAPLRIGNQESTGARFAEAQYCALGQAYLSEFVVTLDLPRRLAWFERPAKEWSSPAATTAPLRGPIKGERSGPNQKRTKRTKPKANEEARTKGGS